MTLPSSKSHAAILSDLARLANEHKISAATHAATQEAYRYGRVDRRTQHFQPLGFSGDSAALESHDLMHRRIRSELINNSQIRGADRDFVDLIIGSGMLAYADPFVPWEWLDLATFDQSQFDDDLGYMLESDHVFDEWANDPAQCDADGKQTWWEMQRMLLREAVRVGFAMLLRVSDNTPGRLVPRCYQILEREQLDTAKDRPAGLGGENKIVNGVEVDSRGRAVAYWILGANPYDTMSSGNSTTQSTRIAASRILPLCAWDRPSETVGVTWFAAIGQNLFDRDGFLAAELQTARKQALLAMVIERKRAGSGSFGLSDGMDEDDFYGNTQIKLGSSPVAAEIQPGEKVELVESKRPNAQAEPFIGMLDRDSAHGLGLSVHTLTGNYNGTSFVSARAAKLDEDGHIKPLQAWFANHVAIPVRREINRELIAFGKLTTTSFAEYGRNQSKYDRFEAFPCGRDFISPQEEVDAAIAKLRSGQSTLKHELAARGKHWIKVLLQRSMESRVIDRLGVTVDFSKGNGGNVATGDSGTGGNAATDQPTQNGAAA